MVLRRGSYPQVESRAVDLMRRGVLVVPDDSAVVTAARMARRRGVALVATRHGARWAGVTPETLDHALRLRLDRAPIDAVLWDAPVVAPDAVEVDVRRRLGPAQPFLLVVHGREPVGVVLREGGAPGLPLDLSSRIEALPPALLELLRLAGTLGQEMDAPIVAVGGFVRDLLLDRVLVGMDLDLVVAGDARALVRRLAGRVGGRLVEHPTFGTATVELGDGRRVDVAMARRERYVAAGALPDVEAATLEEDLARRDFSINAMAVRLDGPRWGELVDTTGGLPDLRARRLRVLHPLSFVEDPTRILRAARFAARLGCRIDPGTRRLAAAAAALGPYAALSAQRVRAELERLLAEPRALRALTVMDGLAGWGVVGPRAARSPARRRVQDVARRLGLGPDHRLALLVLSLTPDAETAEAWARRLGLRADVRGAMRRARADAPALLRRLRAARERGRAFALVREATGPTAAWALAAGPRGPAVRRLDRVLRRRPQRPLVTGDDLIAQGMEPGPALGAVLRQLAAAQAAGRVRGRAGALRWARAALRGGTSRASLTRTGQKGG